MSWQLRHQGSPRSIKDLDLAKIIVGLREGMWEVTDEVMGPTDKTWIAIEAHPQLAAIAAEMEPPPPPVHPDETKLDMNALIDVCLVLLIFFIMTATYAAVQKVVPVEFTADTQEGAIKVVKKSDVDTYMIKVKARPTSEGSDRPVIWVEGQRCSLEQFPSVIDNWVKKTRHHVMLFDVEGVTWGTAIKIQDAAKFAGINRINYLTQLKKR
jgi:biopolymer transport protein ExbD